MSPINLCFIALITWVLFEIIYFLTHIRALNEKEIHNLSIKRTKKYINKIYNFQLTNVSVNMLFKSSMNPAGAWYDTHENLYSFPSLVAALLKGKKHEWVVLAIEQNGIVYGFYANKGINNSEVSFNCSLDFIMNKCKLYRCETIIRFHNHPNSNPRYQNCLVASDQDIKSAKLCSSFVNENYNWIDFVCERGRFLKFFECYSKNFTPKCAKIENIINENDISIFKNYKLHRELGIFH